MTNEKANILKAFIKNKRGATSIEYALIIGLIFLVIIASANSLGQSVTNKFNYVSSSINAAFAR